MLNVNDARANIAAADAAREQVLHGAATIEERLCGLTFEATAHSFLQTNSAQAEVLYAAAVEAAALTGSEKVLDVYCGAGTISLALWPFDRDCEEAIVHSGKPFVEAVRRQPEVAVKIEREIVRVRDRAHFVQIESTVVGVLRRHGWITTPDEHLPRERERRSNP